MLMGPRHSATAKGAVADRDFAFDGRDLSHMDVSEQKNPGPVNDRYFALLSFGCGSWGIVLLRASDSRNPVPFVSSAVFLRSSVSLGSALSL